MCFPVNIEKFLRTPILKNICERLVLRDGEPTFPWLLKQTFVNDKIGQFKILSSKFRRESRSMAIYNWLCSICTQNNRLEHSNNDYKVDT